MRFELITTALDSLSFILVTPRLVGLANLRRFNRIAFHFLSRLVFDSAAEITLRALIVMTLSLGLGLAIIYVFELPWLMARDAALFGAGFNATHHLTPFNVVLAFAGFLAYAVAPLILIMGWLEVLMTRYEPEGAMLLAGGVLFLASRFLTVLHAMALGG